MTSQEAKAITRQSLGMPEVVESKPTVPVEAHVCDFPIWSYSKLRSTATLLKIAYEDGSFFTLDAPKGMPGPSFPGYLDCMLFFGQKDLFLKEHTAISVYQIFHTLRIDPTDGRNYEYFRRDMRRAFYMGLETDRFRNPTTGQRSHVRYFRVLQTMELAKSRREVSTFYFDPLFLASLRAGYLKRLAFDFCLHLDRQTQPLARFLYGHILKRIGEKSMYPRNFIGFLRDCGLGYIADLPTYRRNARVREVVFPALDLLKGEAIRSYELDDEGNIFFIPKS